MEKDRVIDQNITERTKQVIAKEYGRPVGELEVVGVNGGYSRNRRSLVRVGDEWIFAKEVDLSLLPGDGTEELGWLKKDHEVTRYLDNNRMAIAPEWSRLVADGHVLLLPSYRDDDGWIWDLPKGQDMQTSYVTAVVNATKALESMTLDNATIEQLNAKPFFRDELAFDDGFSLLLANEAIREQVSDKYRSLITDQTLPHLEPLLGDIIGLLNDNVKLQTLAEAGRRLVDQPNDSFGHCDVRSDNIAYNPTTDEVKLVDWNWASLTPKGFGPTEFLIDMARRGVDVAPWLNELNPGLLAAMVGFCARRCIKDPLMPGSTLRDMQAESGAIAYSLYCQVVGE